MNRMSLDSCLRTFVADYGLPATMVEQADSAIDSCLIRLPSASDSRTPLEYSESHSFVTRLFVYCASMLRQGARDPEVLLCGGVTTWWYCPNELGVEFWSALHEVGHLNVLWPIFSAMHVELASGVPTGEPLATFLEDRHLEAEARRAVSELTIGDGRRLKLWWPHVLSLLGAPDRGSDPRS